MFNIRLTNCSPRGTFRGFLPYVKDLPYHRLQGHAG